MAVEKGLHLEEELQSTLLDTPTYTLSLVLLFFLILTLGFEKAQHWLQRRLRRMGREGLALAVEKLVNEITLLGFVSLILILFQQYVPSICTTFDPGQFRWTLLQNLDGCDCCLTKTHGVSKCNQIYLGCAFNTSNKEVYCGCEEGWDYSTYNDSLVPGASEAGCVDQISIEEQFAVEQFMSSLQSLTGNVTVNVSDFCTVLEADLRGEVAPESISFPNADLLKETIDKNRSRAITSGEVGRRLLQAGEGLGVLMNQTLKPLIPGGDGNSSTDSSSEKSSTGGDAETANSESKVRRYIIPEIPTYECDGPFYSASCEVDAEGNPTHPAISDEALHQTHLLLFLIAAGHIIAAVLIILLAALRMKQWRRWQNQSIADDQVVMNLQFSGDVRSSEMSRQTTYTSSKYSAEIIEAPEGVEEMKEPEQQEDRNGSGAVEEKKEQFEQERDLEHGTAAAGANGAVADANTSPLNDPEEDQEPVRSPNSDFRIATLKNNAAEGIQALRQHWVRRDSTIIQKHGFVREALICFGQALLPNLVSRQEFIIARHAYIRSLNLAPDYDFVEDMTLHLDFDFIRIVGGSLTIWLILIAQWLLSGLAGWITFVFMTICAFLLLVINVCLVVIVRYHCRGGRAHRVKVATKWWRNPRYLASPIGGIVFFFSTIFSTAVFFWWQFGTWSCFFQEEQKLWEWMPGDAVPWWTTFLPPAVVLFWLGSVTVPAWGLVMHMSPDIRHLVEGSHVSTHLMPGGSGKGQKRKKKDTKVFRRQAEVMEEIRKLQEELYALQEL